MSREDAIKSLYEYRHCFWDKLYEPICMAINALTTIDAIKSEIPTLSHYHSDDGQDLVMVADVWECIDNHMKGEHDAT